MWEKKRRPRARCRCDRASQVGRIKKEAGDVERKKERRNGMHLGKVRGNGNGAHSKHAGCHVTYANFGGGFYQLKPHMDR